MDGDCVCVWMQSCQSALVWNKQNQVSAYQELKYLEWKVNFLNTVTLRNVTGEILKNHKKLNKLYFWHNFLKHF